MRFKLKKLKKEKAIEKLEVLEKQINTIRQKESFSPDFKKWERDHRQG